MYQPEYWYRKERTGLVPVLFLLDKQPLMGYITDMEEPMGKCHVELSATVNIGNFQSVKATVGYEEEYTSDETITDAACRESKFEELLKICSENLDDAVLTEVHKIQALTGKKEKVTVIED